jgi:pantoate--beta-alanine ligase
MIIFKTADALQSFLFKQPAYPAKTGFVPTMGALHAGHITLLKKSVGEQDLTVASIFVNPTQFNDPADFKNYPVTIETDILQLEKAGCDILFLPTVDEIYPGGNFEKRHYELGSLETLLEGHFRPGHFQGVCQVMDRLLTIIRPGHLYMGSKDYQQCMVIKKLIGLLHLAIEFHMVQTIREPDGLALSSRNLRLNADERKTAVSIFKQFDFIKHHAGSLPLQELIEKTSSNLLASGFLKVDYVSIADPASLKPLEIVEKGEPFLVLIAAFLGKVRLIDNMEITL